jgi:hypothetical protein
VSGRHAKPPSKLATTCDEAIRSFSVGRRRWRLIAAGSGAGALALAAMVVAVALSAGGEGGAARHQAAKPATPAANATQMSAGAVVADGTAEGSAVVGYFKTKDTKVAGHVQRVSRDGQFFRVYTDYPEEDANSTSAISLCDWTSGFLKGQGDTGTVVFVHGTSSDNGSVVLANKVSPTDSCKVDETK